jgi:hypothetical protein
VKTYGSHHANRPVSLEHGRLRKPRKEAQELLCGDVIVQANYGKAAQPTSDHVILGECDFQSKKIIFASTDLSVNILLNFVSFL